MPPAQPGGSVWENELRSSLANYVNVTDGVSRTLVRLVDYLYETGNSVLVIGPSSSGKSPPRSARRGQEYVSVASLPMPGRPEYRFALGLPGSVSKRLEAFSPDVVHIATPDLLGLAALKWGRSRRVPVVSTYHTHFPAYLKYYGLEGMRTPVEHYLRWFYGQCRHVYVPTPPLVEYFSGLGITDPVRLWGRGVDCDAFRPDLRSEAWRLDYGIQPEEVLVTFVGRLVKEKGLEVFADVVAELHAEGVRSMIVGDGPLRDDLRRRLSTCTFTGHLGGADLARAYASSDVFLFPSDSEAFGNVIVEAMASGLPVVCAAFACSSTHVVPGTTGLVATSGDVHAFLEQTRHLVRCPSDRRRMARHARLYALHYDWEQILHRMVEYYEEACSA